MICKANAKINSYLSIVGKRDDGYHDLESIFIPISVYDELDIEESDVDFIEGMDIPLEKNLIYKAILEFKKETKCLKNFKVKICKNIPSFAGLGGGSSDAAFTLKALNEYMGRPLNFEALEKVALRLGSDVPFFLYNRPSFVEGRGEIIRSLKIKKVYGVIVFGGDKYSTKEMFGKIKKYSSKININCDDEQNVIKMLKNDFEDCLPDDKVKNIKKRLIDAGCAGTLMTGSGSSVVGYCCDLETAERIYEQVRTIFKKVFVFESI